MRMAIHRRSKSRGRGLSPRPIGYSPALSVTYSAAAAAVAACGAMCYAFYLLPVLDYSRTVSDTGTDLVAVVT